MLLWDTPLHTLTYSKTVFRHRPGKVGLKSSADPPPRVVRVLATVVRCSSTTSFLESINVREHFNDTVDSADTGNRIIF